jgi:hypothetical protein
MNPHHNASLASKQLENKLLNINLPRTFLTSSKNWRPRVGRFKIPNAMFGQSYTWIKHNAFFWASSSSTNNGAIDDEVHDL